MTEAQPDRADLMEPEGGVGRDKLMREDAIISDEMRAALGRTLYTRTSFPISESDIRRWAIAVYFPEDPPRMFWDRAYAATTPHGQLVAPQDFNPFAWITADVQMGQGTSSTPETNTVKPLLATSLDPGCPERFFGIEAPPFVTVLDAGFEVVYSNPMRPGDVIEATTRLVDYYCRRGTTGVLLFTELEEEWLRHDGTGVKTIKYRTIRY